MTLTTDLTNENAIPPARHGLATRLVHTGLAAAIIVQLGSSQVMDPDGAGNGFFTLHQYGGLAALGLLAGFWGLTMWRRRGTPLSLLLPWFDGARLRDLWADIRAHVHSLSRLSLPPHGP